MKKSGEKDSKSGGFTARQNMFCVEMSILGNGTKAAINSGYSEKTARFQAAKLLTKPNIAAKIKELTDARLKVASVTSEKVIDELSKIAFYDIEDLEKKSFIGTDVVKVKDKVAALKTLGEYLNIANSDPTKLNETETPLSDAEKTAILELIEGEDG